MEHSGRKDKQLKSTADQLRSRGFADSALTDEYRKFDADRLVDILNSDEPSARTASARILGELKNRDTLNSLISRLVIETKLYTKIALSESIALFGSEASIRLIPHLGKIGSNQHKALPEKPFPKKSYPLPRDRAARTIIRTGIAALPSLCRCLGEGEYIQVLEAVDAVGFISFYHHDTSSFNPMIMLFEKYGNDDLMIWKLLRALQSFNNQESVNILKNYINSDIIQHRWEAERSLGQFL